MKAKGLTIGQVSAWQREFGRDLVMPISEELYDEIKAWADARPLKLWWCSFADPRAPNGQQFLGVAIVWAPDMYAVCPTTHLLGCNPGGEMRFDYIHEGRAAMVPQDMIGRLLNRGEAEALVAKLDQGIN